MKKIIFLIFTLILFVGYDVYAYDFDYKKVNDKYVLSIIDNNVEISYEEAISKYGINEYMIYTINDTDYYFYLGNQISYDDYFEEMEKRELQLSCESIGTSCIIVNSTDEVIDTIKSLYDNKIAGIYYLFYTSYDYKNIDFDKVNEFYQKEYISDIDKNMYKYDEYYLYRPEKFLLEYDENKLTIDLNIIKTNEEEINKVNTFLETFLKLFDGKSDYEKILGVYTYINNTAQYVVDDGYINFIDGQLSAYDVLIKHKTVCIGNATTFQLLMERLGIESYIVDHVSTKSEDTYATTHTYNIVKLDGEWYIVDIGFDEELSGLLIGINDNYNLDDFIYYDIQIALEDYLSKYPNLSKEFTFDYSYLLDLSIAIDNNEVSIDNEEESNNKNYIWEYLLIGIILVVIFIIIWLFTRKK